jgi:hypothetical protein
MEQVVLHHQKLCAQRALAGLDAIDEEVDDFPGLPGRDTALVRVSTQIVSFLRFC